MTFSFLFHNLDSDDYLTVGINDTQLFALEAGFVGDGIESNSGVLDVSQWAGQDVELFLGLNSQGNAPGGTMELENFQFYSSAVPEPSSIALLSLALIGLKARRFRGR
jgi:hypothetical protein